MKQLALYSLALGLVVTANILSLLILIPYWFKQDKSNCLTLWIGKYIVVVFTAVSVAAMLLLGWNVNCWFTVILPLITIIESYRMTRS